jgi:hypothetical protein
MGPVEDRSRIDLISVHPGVTFDEVQERTAFTLDEKRSRVTAAPSEHELSALRSFPDGRGLRHQTLGG